MRLRPWGLWATKYGARHGLRLVTIARNGCPWMDLDGHWNKSEDPHCAVTLRLASVEAARKYRPEVLILVSRSLHLLQVRTPQGDLLHPEDPAWAEVVREGVSSYLAKVAPVAKQIVLVEPLPETRTRMVACLADPHEPGECDQPELVPPEAAAMTDIYHDLDASSAQITSVSLNALICPRGMCPAEVDGMPTHSDTNHLTRGYLARHFDAWVMLLRTKGISF